MSRNVIINARLSSLGESTTCVEIENGRIKRVGADIPSADAYGVIDARGLFLMPAFVDIHFHGAAGVDFCDAENLDKLAEAKLSEGIGTIVPATLSLPEADIAKALASAAAYVKSGEPFCRLAGVHLEGPFFNTEMAGAQNPEFLKTPDIEFVKRLSSIFKILKISYSPELDANFARQVLSLGIAPSCAHSNATYSEFMKAHDNGLRDISHYGNRLRAIASRDIGAMGAGLLLDDVYIEIIADGLHLSEDMLELILAKKPRDKIILITDSMRGSRMPDGEYDLGGVDVSVKNGQARLKNGALGGSVLKMNEAVRKIMKLGNLTMEEASAMASLVPAQSLGLNDRGKIEAGYLADFVLMDAQCELHSTIIGGEAKFSKTSA